MLLVTSIYLTSGSREESPIFSGGGMLLCYGFRLPTFEFQHHHLLPVQPPCTRERRNNTLIPYRVCSAACIAEAGRHSATVEVGCGVPASSAAPLPMPSVLPLSPLMSTPRVQLKG